VIDKEHLVNTSGFQLEVFHMHLSLLTSANISNSKYLCITDDGNVADDDEVDPVVVVVLAAL
jgi:hypothetical protein